MKELDVMAQRRLLTTFTATGELAEMRPKLASPFEQGGYVCATDTHSMLRVRKDLIIDDYSKDGEYPSVEKVTPEYNPLFLVTKSNLRSAFVRMGIDYDSLMIECPECDDEGNVEWEYKAMDGEVYTMDADCPLCDGCGLVPNGANRSAMIDDKSYQCYQLLKLHLAMDKLGIDSVEVSVHENRTTRFTLADGVDIIIMPLQQDTKPNTIVEMTAKTK